MRRTVAILGVTGSIGTQAVDVILRNRELFDVKLVSAHGNKARLEELALALGAEHAILTGGGIHELQTVLNDIYDELDLILIGSAGTAVLSIAYEAARRGVNLAVANKECIVAAGRQILGAAHKSGAQIIPVDSEHSAVYQCLLGHNRDDVSKIILTASGGAFRDLPQAALKDVTVKDAVSNPNWMMGQKITIDSATMMNKGLELIEARFLFDMPADKLDVVIHPQSIIHSMVSYKDGAVIAQLGMPDMRLAISYGLGYPSRLESGVKTLDFASGLELTFKRPDYEKYRCLKIATDVLIGDRSADMIAMNAANEVAVDAFIHGRISFLSIADIVETVVNKQSFNEPDSIEEVLHIDTLCRELAIAAI